MLGRRLDVKQPAIDRRIGAPPTQGLSDIAERLVIQIAAVTEGMQIDILRLTVIVFDEMIPTFPQFGKGIILNKAARAQDRVHVLQLDRLEGKWERGGGTRRERQERIIAAQEILRPV